MTIKTLSEELANNPYPGRGIVAGRSEDGRHAVTAYFIMGRSANSRNRIFVPDGEGIRTQACDPSKMEDPGLIIYAPVRVLGTNTIVTNGDQTDTICQGLMEGKTFGEALRKRTFEPDAPNYTPRISALLDVRGGEYEYRLSILKSADGDPSSCARFTFTYENPRAGEGHYLHTYLLEDHVTVCLACGRIVYFIERVSRNIAVLRVLLEDFAEVIIRLEDRYALYLLERNAVRCGLIDCHARQKLRDDT